MTFRMLTSTCPSRPTSPWTMYSRPARAPSPRPGLPARRYRPDVAQVAEAIHAEPCCSVPALWPPVS